MEQNTSSFSQPESAKPHKKSCWFWGILSSCLVLLIFFIGVPVALIMSFDNFDSTDYSDISETHVSGSSLDKIALINIRGIIVTTPTYGTDEVAASDIYLMINKAEDDDDVKAIIISIDSPGGTMVGSSLIYKYLKESKKPVVALYSGDVAASGGVYVSMAADKIITNPETITGSIGVIIESYDISGLLNKYGIKSNTIKSGEFKDIGNPSRPMTDAERKILQDLVDESYNKFVKVVADSRKLSIEKVKEFADGRIFSGTKAKEFKLVDEIGYFTEAVWVAEDLANIKSSEVVEYEPPFEFGSLLSLLTGKFGKFDPTSLISLNQQNPSSRLYYLMK